LAYIDLVQDTRALNEDEMIVRATVLVELEKLAKMRKLDGDKNLEFYG